MKKLFTIILLALFVCSGAWADPWSVNDFTNEHKEVVESITITGGSTGDVLTQQEDGTFAPETGGGGSMTYPSAGIAKSTGSAWDTSITDNSANWNTAYGWGAHAGLYDPVGTAAGAVSGHESTYDHTSFVTGTPWADMGYLTEESDPDFTLWLSTFDPFETGDETDPVFGAWLIATPPLYSESDPAVGTHESTYDHTLIATALQAESDPDFNAWDKSTGISITESQISDFGSYLTAESDPAVGTHESTYDHTLIATALQSETDPVYAAWLLATPPLYPGGWYDALQNTINLSDFNDDLSYQAPLTADSDYLTPGTAATTYHPLNGDTTGSAGSLKSTATTGLMTITGPAAGETRAKTIRDANDTLLELGGSYTPTGTWNWTSATATWPTFNQSTSGNAANVTGTVAIANGGTGQTTAQAAVNALTEVAAATNEHVYTKDTATGNATWKAAPGAGGGIDNVVEDTTPQLGGDLDGQGYDLNNMGVLFLTEQAAAEADVAGKGQLWVKTATPNELWFTDDAGTDVQLGTSGGYTNLTSFVNQTAWRLFYSDGDGDVTELAFGTDGQVLTSTGASTAPAFEDAAASVTYATASEINTGTETAKAINPDGLKDSVYGLDRTVQSVTASDGTGTPNVITLDLSAGHIILLTMDEDSEIAFSNVPSGYCRAIVRFIQDAGGDEPWTNQDDFLWPLGVEMDLSTAAGAKDDFQFYTFDGGTTWNVAMIGAEVQ